MPPFLPPWSGNNLLTRNVDKIATLLAFAKRGAFSTSLFFFPTLMLGWPTTHVADYCYFLQSLRKQRLARERGEQPNAVGQNRRPRNSWYSRAPLSKD